MVGIEVHISDGLGEAEHAGVGVHYVHKHGVSASEVVVAVGHTV